MFIVFKRANTFGDGLINITSCFFFLLLCTHVGFAAFALYNFHFLLLCLMLSLYLPVGT